MSISSKSDFREGAEFGAGCWGFIIASVLIGLGLFGYGAVWAVLLVEAADPIAALFLLLWIATHIGSGVFVYHTWQKRKSLTEKLPEDLNEIDKARLQRAEVILSQIDKTLKQVKQVEPVTKKQIVKQTQQVFYKMYDLSVDWHENHRSMVLISNPEYKALHSEIGSKLLTGIKGCQNSLEHSLTAVHLLQHANDRKLKRVVADLTEHNQRLEDTLETIEELKEQLYVPFYREDGIEASDGLDLRSNYSHLGQQREGQDEVDDTDRTLTNVEDVFQNDTGD